MDMTSFIIGYEAGKNSVEKGPETEETTVTLNLSAGDQVVTPSGEDKALSQVTIRKPETLIPGNIAQGVDIAGVVGTLTSGGGGSGGGTLPAGIYLSGSPYGVNPTSNRHKWFNYNGETYAGANSTLGAGVLMYMYKWNGSKWEIVLSTTALNGLGDANIDCQSFKVVEYDGKAHFIDNKYHAVFDGTTFVASTSVPSGSAYPAVYEGKLYAYSNNDYTLYQWDDITSTWSTVVTFSEEPTKAFSFNGELYFYVYSDDGLYRYDNGTLTRIGTITHSVGNFLRVNDSLYLTEPRTNTYDYLYRFDFEAGEDVYIGRIPTLYGTAFSENTNDISFVGTTAKVTSTSSGAFQFYVANIVEATE